MIRVADVLDLYNSTPTDRKRQLADALRRTGLLGTGGGTATVDLTGIDLSNYSEVGHAHTASDIISGVFDPDRIPPLGNIDGGVPDSVYTPIAAIDGGTP